MNPPPSSSEPSPEPVRAGRAGPLAASFLASLALNVLGFAALLFVTVGETARRPPAIVVASGPPPPEDPAPPPRLDRPRIAPNPGGSPSAPAIAIAVAATAGTAVTLPDLPSFDDGVAGLPGIGTSFGSGGGWGGGGPGGSMGSMKVGRISVKAMRLGVILDVSGSMEEELPGVKREVRKAFRQAKTVEVEGCRLDWREPAGGGGGKVNLQKSAGSVIEAVEMLVVDGKVDAIYWFSDLQDGETEAGIGRLGELLGVDRGKGRAVRFYIRSLEREPSAELVRIVRASDGAVQAGEKVE